MSEAYSGYVTEWHGGRTRAYVKGWISSETDKTATIYVWGCAEGEYITYYGVRTRVYINGTQVNTTTDNIFTEYGIADFAALDGALTINKGSGAMNIQIACSIEGEIVNDYAAIGGSATAYASVWVGPKVLSPPSAPTGLTGARNAAAGIDLAWKNNSNNVIKTQIDICPKGGSWETIFKQEAVLTSYTHSPGIGTYKYRVRYWNSDGYSAYSNETGYIVTLCAPAAPTTLMPTSGSTLDANAGEAVLKWQHNTIDSSDQTAAEVRWSTDNVTFTTAKVTTAKEYGIPISSNEDIYWQVRTKGAHDDFGPWSGVSMFLVRTAPSIMLHVTDPVTSVPFDIEWDYEDAYGTQLSYVAIIEQASDSGSRTTISGGTAKLVTITPSIFTPSTGQDYSITVSVTSTTGLQATAVQTISVQYSPPATPAIAAMINSKTASCTVTIFEGKSAPDVPETVAFNLYRDGTLLATGLHTGQVYEDETPPLDCEVVYRAVAYAGSGSAAERQQTVIVKSGGFAFFNWDDACAKVGMNIKMSDQTEGEREFYAVGSSPFPRVFYGAHNERTGTITADVLWYKDVLRYGEEAMLSAVELLKEHNGLVYLRLPYSDAFRADVTVSSSRSTDSFNVAGVSIDWRRVE